jgi:predicted secreted acid phosphatase
MQKLLTETELTTSIHNNADYIKNILHYINYYYYADLLISFKKSINMIKNNLCISNSTNRRFDKPNCVVIDLDETFLQNPDFFILTKHVWSNLNLRSHYEKKSDQNTAPLLPFMYILYSYLQYHHINIIFLTGRRQIFHDITVTNLARYSIHDYTLIMRPDEFITPSQFKQNTINQIEQTHNILAILNDQPEIIHANLIQYPQLYIVV